MRFKIGNHVIWLNTRIREINKDDTVIGLESGKAFGGHHYVFLDYDKTTEKIVLNDFSRIVHDYSLKRGIIMKSSENSFHCLSFTPLAYAKMLEVISKSAEDKNHKAWTIKNGSATLRIMQKRNGSLPEFVKSIVNMEGKNFYNFNAEKAYFKLLEGNEGD
jgi:hypothetical protein